MMRWLFGGRSPHAAFALRKSTLLQAWFDGAARSGLPRGLTWTSWIEAGEAVRATDLANGQLLALAPVVVQFEPIVGGGLDDVPQAREPRAVVAVFRWTRRTWVPDGRAIFNLTPVQVLGRSGGRWVIQQPA